MRTPLAVHARGVGVARNSRSHNGLWPLNFGVHGSNQMSTRCPIGHLNDLAARRASGSTVAGRWSAPGMDHSRGSCVPGVSDHADQVAADDTVRVIHPSKVRLCVTQTRPVLRRLGFSSEQRTQFALLLGDKHTDNLPTHLRHADPAHIGDTLQPDQH